MLSLNHVTKKYGKFTALEDINLEFNRGIYALLGPNGSGKTTLIKMLTTLIFPTNGEILWNGDEIIKLDAAYRNVIGYLPQNFGYYKNHSPYEFLLYLAALKCMDTQKARQRATELLELVGLSDVKDKKMKKFSGGMIQRVGIAQSMLNNPQILILDEPTAGLDPKERIRFRNLISSLSKERIVILSTHIVSDIETIASRIIMLKDHKLLINETPCMVCKLLEGKVYETDKIEMITAQHLMLTEHQANAKTMVRFFCDEDCSHLASRVVPNLEDVFLHVYRDKVSL